MSVMLNGRNRYTCEYGRKCCDGQFYGKRHGAKTIRRNVKRKERQEWRSRINDMMNGE